MSDGLTKRQKEVRIAYAMIKLHLNTAETMIKKMRDEIGDLEPDIKTQALQFTRTKVQDLYTKFREVR